MKRYFLTGLVILLPVALTLAIVLFIINILTDPFIGVVKTLFGYYGLFVNGFLFFSADQIQRLFSQVVILVMLFFFTAGLGLLARWFFFHYLVQFWEYIVHRIPLIRSVYKTCQDVINTLFETSSNSFKKVVMVPFPSRDSLSIGFVTKEDLPPVKNTEPLIAIFVPTTPNPTSGFLMMFEPKDVTYLDMSVEDALKYIVSCGMIAAPMNFISKEEAERRMKPS